MRKTSIFTKVLVLVLACLMLLSVVGCDNGTDNGSYTYNDYIAGSPKNWSAHEWETNEDSYIMTFTEMGLYDFVLNEAKDGYDIIPEMAADMPVDVTAEFAGNATYGVPADATKGWAFKIPLNEKAKWEDGTVINADTYIYSMQQLLDPKMKNYRANSYYSGTLTIAGAESYFKQNQPIYADVVAATTAVAESDMYFTFNQLVYFFGSNTAKEYYDAGYSANFVDANGVDLYNKYYGGENAEDYIKLTDEAKADILTVAKAFGDTNPEAWKEFCVYITGYSDSFAWENVGIIKSGDYEITLILSKEITDFYLKYNLSSNWIVYEPLYEAGKKEVGTLTKTDYGTSAETYMSYGPYKLTEFQLDKQITIVKNDQWYGYTDGKHKGQFQTTAINTQVVKEHATALQLFLQGGLDNVSLDATDMETYRNSDFIMFTPESYTSKFTFNSDYAALKAREVAGINKTLLSYLDFRKAISFAMNRADFAAQCTATHSAGFGLLNYMYVADPETGMLYRDTAAAEKTLCDVYGVEDVTKITGYDKELAKQLFQSAYDAALAAGDIKASDKVEIEFNVYQNDDAYVKMVNFVQNAVTEATVGTSLEGKISIKMVANEDYYDGMQAGTVDMIISTWGGAAMDPFGITECYATDMYFEYGFDYDRETLTINVEGKDITKSYNEWYNALCNGEYSAAAFDTRVAILAAFEKGILESYRCPPIYYRTSASLESRKIQYPTDTYIQLVAYGGIRFMTYEYNDTEWADYVSSQGSQLTY